MIQFIRNRSPRRCFNAELFVALTIFLSAARADAITGPPNVVTGNVRVQLLSGSLLRIELKGPAGF
jgi:hypothetical protein